MDKASRMQLPPLPKQIYVAFAAAIFAMPCPAIADTPASAELVRGGMIDGSSPERLAEFMTQLGYEADLSRDDYGDPIIYGRLSATDYAIQFYECENGAFCNSIQFVAETAPPADLSMEKINQANQRWRYARVSAAGPTLRIQMDVNLDGGVTALNVEDTLYIWRRLIERFEQDFPPPVSPASQRVSDLMRNGGR